MVPPIAARSGAATLSGWYPTTSEIARRLYIPAAALILVFTITAMVLRLT